MPTLVHRKEWTGLEHETWKEMYHRQEASRRNMAYLIFEDGLDVLGFTEKKIPDLDSINAKLNQLTGWKGVLVKGLEEGADFYPMLARREFPLGNFIRDKKDLSYTPEPDIFHDLYGHIPFYANKKYADACWEFAKRASKYVDQPEKLVQWERLFWFTYEFGLIETPKGRRIFGGGILSSYGECIYSMDEVNGPEVLPFDLEVIRNQAFRIDEMQKRLFILKNPEQLYDCLDDFEAGM